MGKKQVTLINYVKKVLTMMINNSTYIKKMNIHLSLSPKTIEHKKGRLCDMALEIKVLAWDKLNNVVGLNLQMRSYPF